MSETKKITDQDVLAYLSFLQQNISRMASNSASCKTICVAIVTVLCSVSTLKGGTLFCGIFLASAIFCYLDVMYLSLEKSYREKYNNASSNYKNSSLSQDDIFDMNPGNYVCAKKLAKLFTSLSVCPVYVTILLLAIVVSAMK